MIQKFVTEVTYYVYPEGREGPPVIVRGPDDPRLLESAVWLEKRLSEQNAGRPRLEAEATPPEPPS